MESSSKTFTYVILHTKKGCATGHTGRKGNMRHKEVKVYDTRNPEDLAVSLIDMNTAALSLFEKELEATGMTKNEIYRELMKICEEVFMDTHDFIKRYGKYALEG